MLEIPSTSDELGVTRRNRRSKNDSCEVQLALCSNVRAPHETVSPFKKEKTVVQGNPSLQTLSIFKKMVFLLGP